MIFWSIVIFLLLLLNVGFLLCLPTCSYTPPIGILGGVNVKNPLRRARSSSFEPLRIYTHYDSTFTSQPEHSNLMRIVEDSIAYWQRALQIRSPVSQFWLNRHCNTDLVRFLRNSSTGVYQYYCKDGCQASTVCGHVTIPTNHMDVCRYYLANNMFLESGVRGTGISGYNYALYISSYPDSSKCGSSSNTLAYAAHCQLQGLTDRPIAGYINFCPGKLASDYAYLSQAMFAAKHEILHALGFSVSLFAFMRELNGSPRTARSPTTDYPTLGYFDQSLGIYKWNESTVAKVEVPWESARGNYILTKYLVTTPRVVETARKHFNCSTLRGLELENQGEVGISLTHWEKRMLENELMTPTYTHRFIVSEMTLAFLEDTGWYVPDYSMSETLAWGKGLGCIFAQSSCLTWFKFNKNNSHPYCSDYSGSSQRVFGCSSDRKSKVYCNLGTYSSDVPLEYQYFSSDKYQPNYIGQERPVSYSKLGGSVNLADYCPFPQEYTIPSSSGQHTRTSDCFDIRNSLSPMNNPFLESFLPSALCINHPGSTIIRTCQNTNFYRIGSTCHRYYCSDTQGLVVQVGSYNFSCSASKQINFNLNSEFYNVLANLECPVCSDVCPVCPTSPQLWPTPPVPRTIPCVSPNCALVLNLQHALVISTALLNTYLVLSKFVHC